MGGSMEEKSVEDIGRWKILKFEWSFTHVCIV